MFEVCISTKLCLFFKMANKTDQWSFLWNLSRRLKKVEVRSLQDFCSPLFGVQVYKWSCFELFENLVETRRIKFTSDKKPANWCILKELLVRVQRRDLARDLDDFGNSFEDADVLFRESRSKLQIGPLLSENNCRIYKGTYATHYDVVIKEFYLPQKLSREEEILEKKLFCDHQDLVMSFKHENILGFHDIFLDMKGHSPPCIVFGYFPDMDLAQSLRSDKGKSMGTNIFIKYAKQIISGLKYLHDNKVLHCNLRADNILLENSNKIKISGFLSARKLKDDEDILDLDEDVKLAMKWMPLEVVLHRRFCGASDIWSFGVVLVEMFNYGTIPYPELSNEETIKFISRGNRHSKPDKCPDSIYNGLMLKCWHIDANERPTLDSVLNILDNNSINQKIKDIQIPEIVNDLKNRRSIYIRKSKTRSFFPQARVSFQDIIPQEQITISSEVLGEGVHGFVLKGLLKYGGKDVEVAMKTVNPHLCTREEFQREINIMKKLHHPNIVFMIGVCEHFNKNVYLVTELMPNGSLIQLLREMPEVLPTPNALLTVAVQVCRGMTYLEDMNIIHRDLAARNVLIGDNYEIFKISDFGMSTITDETNQAEKVDKISLRWSAPEVLESQIYGMKADVWSYGILLVELFAYGDCPYKEWNMADIKPKILKGFKHCQPNGCPDNVYMLMTKCWCKFPNNRPPFRTIMKELDEITSQFKPGIYLNPVSTA